MLTVNASLDLSGWAVLALIVMLLIAGMRPPGGGGPRGPGGGPDK